MPREIVRAVTAPLRLLWRITGKPIYQRLFGRYFQATISRLNSTLGELSDMRAELDEARREILACQAQQEELDGQMRSVIGGYWDTAALARRLAAIEDRVSVSEQPAGQTLAEPEELDLEGGASVEAEQPGRA